MIAFITRVALSEDINAPYVWLSETPCNSRDIVKITNIDTTKSIWCEVVKASDNYIKRYNNNVRTLSISSNKPFIVANSWYRNKLDLVKNTESNITLKTSRYPLFVKQLLASYTHPDNAVRLATDIALVSLFLGIVGLVLGIISLCK